MVPESCPYSPSAGGIKWLWFYLSCCLGLGLTTACCLAPLLGFLLWGPSGLLICLGYTRVPILKSPISNSEIPLQAHSDSHGNGLADRSQKIRSCLTQLWIPHKASNKQEVLNLHGRKSRSKYVVPQFPHLSKEIMVSRVLQK